VTSLALLDFQLHEPYDCCMPRRRDREGSADTAQADFRDLSRKFGTDPGTLIEALLGSPNARGYLLGSITEVLIRRALEAKSYELQRIKEKWVGPKLHHGDYYVRRGKRGWFVLESKGLKSNSEKWHKIARAPTDPARLEAWMREKGGEFGAWWDSLSRVQRERILRSRSFPRALILETHFVAGTGGRTGRRIATPRKQESHVVALDLFIKTHQHEFIYATTNELESPEDYPDHLKQNYLIDILVPGVDTEPIIRPPWTRDFDVVFNRLAEPVRDQDRQVDTRAPGQREVGVEEDDSGEVE
jgi:hypothetical protein